MSLDPIKHSLQLWYYPPQVQDVVVDLETAAQGYTEHLDTFNPTQGFKCRLDKVKNQMSNESKLTYVLFLNSDSWPMHSWSQSENGQDHHIYPSLPVKPLGAETCCQHCTSTCLVH